MKKNRKIRALAGIAVLVTIIALISFIPVLTASRYTHPLMDDFDYGSVTYHAWLSTHSFPEVLKAAFQQSIDRYMTWQGSWAGIFVMGLVPSIFGEKFYGITAYLNILLLFSGTYIFCKNFCQFFLHKNKIYAWILTIILVTVEVNFMPDPVQGIYWFNGGLYYTGFYSLFLIYCSSLVKILFSDKKVNLALPLIMLFMIMGSNLSVILITLLITAGCTVYAFRTKKNQRYLLIIMLVVLAGFVLNVGAPGYRVRQDETPSGMGAALTIIESIFYTLNSLEQYTTLYNLVIFAILFLILQGSVHEFPFKVRRPVFITIVLLGIYTAQFAPGYYSTGTPGFGRLLNLSFFHYYWLIIGLMMIWLAWAEEHIGNVVAVDILTSWIKNKFSVTAAVVLIAFGLAVFGRKMPTAADPSEALCLRTAAALRDGRAAEYNKERNECAAILEKGKGKDIILPHLQTEPDMITMPHYFVDSSATTWSNVQIAKYYQLSSVVSTSE